MSPQPSISARFRPLDSEAIAAADDSQPGFDDAGVQSAACSPTGTSGSWAATSPPPTTGRGWLTLLWSLTARGLTEAKIVTSDADAELGRRDRRHPYGAAWQRCRTHYTTNLMAITRSRRGRGCIPCCTRCSTSLTLNLLAHSTTGLSMHWQTTRRPWSPSISKTPVSACAYRVSRADLAPTCTPGTSSSHWGPAARCGRTAAAATNPRRKPKT